jgi:hypothetical protein
MLGNRRAKQFRHKCEGKVVTLPFDNAQTLEQRSTRLIPRTITWRMLPTVLAQPNPCSISLRLRCDSA